MIGKSIFEITEKLKIYIQSENQNEPFMYIYGEKGKTKTINGNKEKTKTSEIRQLSISSNNDILELKELLNSLYLRLHNYIEIGENNITIDDKIKNFDESDDLKGIFFKYMNKTDLEQTQSLSLCVDNKIDFIEFTKTKYDNTYLITEINLNANGEKKLILFKSIKKQYSVKSDKFKNFFIVSLFDPDKTHKIKFIDPHNQLIMDDNFEIIAFIDESVSEDSISETHTGKSFFIIQNRIKFEDFYNYHENYEKAFTFLSSRFDFINWNVVGNNINMKRTCYAIYNFPYLENSISQLKSDLMSDNENNVKKAFFKKSINYEIDGANLKVNPKNVNAFRALFKIMADVLSETCLLKRSMLGEEELAVPQQN